VPIWANNMSAASYFLSFFLSSTTLLHVMTSQAALHIQH